MDFTEYAEVFSVLCINVSASARVERWIFLFRLIFNTVDTALIKKLLNIALKVVEINVTVHTHNKLLWLTWELFLILVRNIYCCYLKEGNLFIFEVVVSCKDLENRWH